MSFLKDILAVSGTSGLYKVVARTGSGIIVESLTEKKRTVISTLQKVSMLDDISMFTKGDDKPLKEVLIAIKEKHPGELPVSPKSEPAALKAFFKSVFPDYAEDRVYHSDMKKIISWYLLLKDSIVKEATEEAGQKQ